MQNVVKTRARLEARGRLENQASGRFLSSPVAYFTNGQMGRVGVEPIDITAISNNNLGNAAIPDGAKSGAVPENSQNLEMLAALVNILTPEQKAAFMALLSAPTKPNG